MKYIATVITVCFLIGFTSCKTDTKESENTTIEVEQIESIEKEVDSISNTIDKEAEDLEDALNELDNI